MGEFLVGTMIVGGVATAAVKIGKSAFRLSDVWCGAGAPNSIRDLLSLGESGMSELQKQVDQLDIQRLSPISGLLAPPVLNPRKLICIGTNYSDHNREMDAAARPKFPYAFIRPITCLCAHGEAIRLPVRPEQIDWEAELAIVIGSTIRNATGQAALDGIGGYTIVTDISARDWIKEKPIVGTDWVMQKAWDKFQPTGPWIKPARFVDDPQSLDISLTVNGIEKQNSNTRHMIFGVQQIVEHLSMIMTLEPGDIIATGTPSGVGFARNPPEFMKAGDVVKTTVAGIGELENQLI